MTVNQEEWLAEAATETLKMDEMDSLVAESVKLWDDYDTKKKASGEAHALAEAHDVKIIQALTNAGKKSYKVDGIGTVTRVQKMAVSTPKSVEDKMSFFKYLKNLAGEDVMWGYISVNSNSLNSWYKEHLENLAKEGKVLKEVPGIDGPTMRENLAFRKDS